MIATWNVCTLSDHILRYVLDEAGYDVCVLTETHGVPPSFDQVSGDNPGRIIRSCPCDVSDRAAGVVIVLSKQAARLVLSSGTDDPRSAWVRLRGIYNLTIYGVYVPHAHRRVAPWQTEYLRDLETNVRNLQTRHPRDCQILLGDTNCKLARGVKGITGPYSMHKKSSKGGERLLELLKNTNLVASSTRFCPPKTAPLGSGTYYTPKTEKREKRLSQIDHICVSQRYANSVTSSKVRWYPAIRRHTERYDHGLVEINFRFRIAARNTKGKSHKRLDFTVLKEEETRLELDAQVKANLDSSVPGTTRDEEYRHMIKAVQEAQEKVLPVLKNTKHKGRPISNEANFIIKERARRCQAARTRDGKRQIKEEYRRTGKVTRRPK